MMQLRLNWLVLALVAFMTLGRAIQATAAGQAPDARESDPLRQFPSSTGFQAPPAFLSRIDQVENVETRELIRYGKDLFVHTAYYLGPKGKVAHNTSRMNCQNCHLDAGARRFGNDLTQTLHTYPTYRAREGKVLNLEERINNCVERPMSGTALALDSREMKGLAAYISWLSTVPLAREVKPGENLAKVALPQQAASSARGAHIFKDQCARCHGENGEGLTHADGISFLYPPLWGPESFSMGSSMTRVLKFAAFVKTNMPFGTSWTAPVLTDMEALDVAAFVNDPVHKRPTRWDLDKDYPRIEEKPIDLAVGPYVDPFTEEQHRVGPFAPLAAFYENAKRASTSRPVH